MAIVAAISLILLWETNVRQPELFKPYISYVKLINLATACDDYKRKYGTWPGNIKELAMLRPDLEEASIDAYGNQVVLVPVDPRTGYGELISYGHDGKPGGTDVDKDIIIKFPIDANADWNKQQGAGLKPANFNN